MCSYVFIVDHKVYTVEATTVDEALLKVEQVVPATKVDLINLQDILNYNSL